MKKFYEIVSHIFQPLLIPTYGVLLLINMDIFGSLPVSWHITAFAGTLFFTGIVPAFVILLMLRKGTVHDVFISRREERTLPYISTLVSYAFWVIFLWLILRLPLLLLAIGISVMVSVILITLINIRWKISAHLAGIGALGGGVVGLAHRLSYNPIGLLFVVLVVSALVALARLQLKAHSPGQVTAGYLLGFATVLVPCIIF
jgi:membrane-associated phospholipid phosphatase